ncbi:MAG: EAL domain-containing protein [Dechloromonas sp.]|nr:EAL domain-containing protein [Dechloromonas sp.]
MPTANRRRWRSSIVGCSRFALSSQPKSIQAGFTSPIFVPMPIAIHPGFLIALLYFCAGISVLAALIGYFVKFDDFGLRGQKWLVALCASVSAYLVAIALHHTSESLDAAVTTHKLIDVGALLNLFFLCGFVARQMALRKSAALVVWAVAGLVVIAACLSFYLPLGGRFSSITATDLMVFSWGERLLILRGQPTDAAAIIKFLLIVPFVWMAIQFASLYRGGEKLRAGLMGGGTLVITFGVAMTRLIDSGTLDFVYPAGLGYMVFVFLAVTHASRGAKNVMNQVNKLSAAVEQSPTGILLVNSENRIEYANGSFLTMTGYVSEQILGTHPQSLRADDTPTRLAEITEALSIGKTWKGELKIRCTHGREVAVFAVISPMVGVAGLTTNYVMEMEDLTQQKQMEAGLQLYASIFANSGEGSLICDADNRIITVNAAFTRITGYGIDDVRGKNPRVLSSGLTPIGTYRDMWSELGRVGYWQGEVMDRRRDGSIFPKWLSISVVHDQTSTQKHYVGSFTDISERKAVENRIAFLAHHDNLTGLLNRFSLQDRLEQALLGARRQGQMMAVGIFDLDRFKQVNDTLGHAAGDALLVEVARRLRGSLRESDIVARLGGDEFVVALTDVKDQTAASRTAEKLLDTLCRPYLIEGRGLNLGASLGLALYPNDGNSAETLMKNADTAMYQAKMQGGSNALLFTSAMNEAVVDRLKLEHELREALASGQFELHYQPKFDGATKCITGFEALVRWRHPGRGLVSPAEFIPVAEETGLIQPLGNWVIREACSQLRAWREEGVAGLSVAVNLSVHQLRSSDLLRVVVQALHENRLDGADLELEITESAAMEDPEASIAQLNALQQLGVRLSIDDFGTGYSSLNYLKRLPVHSLKLDRSFVRDIETDPNDVAICAATIALAHSLGLTVVAEGIETVAQHEFLQSQHCDCFQGYLFGRPMPPLEALDLLLTSNVTLKAA